MKRLLGFLLVFVAVVVGGASSTSCGGKARVDGADTLRVTVAQVMQNPDLYVNKEVAVLGRCVHLCAHGGRKAFLASRADSTVMIRCDATGRMDGVFNPKLLGKEMTVVGILREERIDENTLHRMAEDYAARQALIVRETSSDSLGEIPIERGCLVEQKAIGQEGIDDFEERMANFRQRIAQRNADEHKPYLSIYTIDVTSYE